MIQVVDLNKRFEEQATAGRCRSRVRARINAIGTMVLTIKMMFRALARLALPL
ncbi:MAG TPA: hypothetical protein VE422_18765 [Terriglobia bacterium]|nr:hypothetical protein [Terriglobia bacterium]